jgi:hypothetical protein
MKDAVIFFLILLFFPLLNSVLGLAHWFRWKFGEKEKRRCKNCFYNVIMPSRDDLIFGGVSESDRVCRNPATAMQHTPHGSKYFKSLYKCDKNAGWNCPYWIKRSPNQPEVRNAVK